MRKKRKFSLYLPLSILSAAGLILTIILVDPDSAVSLFVFNIPSVVLLFAVLTVFSFSMSCWLLKKTRWAALITLFLISTLFLRYIGHPNLLYVLIIAAVCILLEFALRQNKPSQPHRIAKIKPKT